MDDINRMHSPQSLQYLVGDVFDDPFWNGIVIFIDPMREIVLSALHYDTSHEVFSEGVVDFNDVSMFGQLFEQVQLSFEILGGGVDLLYCYDWRVFVGFVAVQIPGLVDCAESAVGDASDNFEVIHSSNYYQISLNRIF